MLDENGQPIRKDPADLIAPVAISNNLQSQLKAFELSNQIQDRKSVETGSLDNITNDMGLQIQGEFRSGTGEPGDGFTGVRIGWPGFSYIESDWNIVGVNNDLLEFGLSAANGKAYFAGGAGTIDKDGINLEGMRKAIEHHYLRPSTGYNYWARSELFQTQVMPAPDYRIRYTEHGPADYATNGGFETGDFTGHTITVVPPDTFVVDSVDVFDGVYSAHAHLSGSDVDSPRVVDIETAVGSIFPATPGNYYSVKLQYKFICDQFADHTLILGISWKDGGGSEISLDQGWVQNDPSTGVIDWTQVEGILQAPPLTVNAAYVVEFRVDASSYPGMIFNTDLFLDDIDIRALVAYKALSLGQSGIFGIDETSVKNLMSGGGGGGAPNILFDGM